MINCRIRCSRRTIVVVALAIAVLVVGLSAAVFGDDDSSAVLVSVDYSMLPLRR